MANLLLGVCGSIAAYKAADLASKLTQTGHHVTVLMTEAATKLVHPNTFMNLTGNPVYADVWDPHGQTQHIALTDAADLCVIAPATANTIGKIAHGLGDDMVSTTLLAVRCPVLICPAMNTRMWNNKAVQRNVKILEELGHVILQPGDGNLACGHVGAGRLPEPTVIAAEIEELLSAAS
jgi:phosphopantothenoylcysteine decarboxylase/phosphopantothenate--cysteine ligase